MRSKIRLYKITSRRRASPKLLVREKPLRRVKTTTLATRRDDAGPDHPALGRLAERTGFCRTLLEPATQEGGSKKGYVGQYKSVTRTMKRTQDDILWIAGLLERFLALCTWQHPRKTLFFCFGLLMAYVVCCLIPNDY